MTHGVDAVVTRGSNTYGPFHHPEKLIPLFITNALDDQPLPLYGDGLQQRDWLYVVGSRGCDRHVLRHGATGETYNVPGSAELTNREVVAALLERLGKPWSLVRSVPDRPGHDRRYAMDGSKLAALGWRNRTSFADGLAATVDWFRANEAWWRAAKSGDWDAYYERQYGARLTRLDRGLRRCASRSRARAEGSAARWSRRSPTPPFTGIGGPIAWTRREFDLDAPAGIGDLLDRDRPEAVVHAAAWTDVDGCARDPELAIRRNGVATGDLAIACAARGVDLLVVSTNEVFDGRRTDRTPYRARRANDPREPIRRIPRREARTPPAPRTRIAAAPSGSPEPPGCTGHRARTSRARSRPPRHGLARPAAR